jgi:hypothetical protein
LPAMHSIARPVTLRGHLSWRRNRRLPAVRATSASRPTTSRALTRRSVRGRQEICVGVVDG